MSTSDVCDRTIVVNVGDNLTFSIDGLTENTMYSFTVVAHVEDHSQPGSFTASIPSEPVYVTISSISKRQKYFYNINRITNILLIIISGRNKIDLQQDYCQNRIRTYQFIIFCRCSQ